MTVQLGLLRHGHTAWNRAGRIQGRTDIPLDDAARTTLRGLGLPAPWSRADLVSSPLARAHETAELVAGRKPTHAPELVEMDWGAWEGERGADLLADPECAYAELEDWGLDFQPPGGESIRAVSDRVLAWADRLEKDTLAVCHIGVMRVLLAAATGWPFRGPAPFQIKRNRIYVLERTGAGWRLKADPVRLPEATPCA